MATYVGEVVVKDRVGFGTRPDDSGRRQCLIAIFAKGEIAVYREARSLEEFVKEVLILEDLIPSDARPKLHAHAKRFFAS